MLVDPTFEFPLSVSQQVFETKPSKDGKISKIFFVSCPQTIDSVLQHALEGRAFCYDFFPDQDGRISIKSKTKENFRSTFTIFLDFDHMDVPMLDYIEMLPYKPSLGYSSYSDGKNGLSSFRLVYVFEDAITNEARFNDITDGIANANGFVREMNGMHGGWDKRCVAQFYYGTSSTASVYKSGIIYCQNDFHQFISTVTEHENTDYYRTETHSSIDSFVVTTTTNGEKQSRISPNSKFLYDFFHLPQNDFFTKYWKDYYPIYKSSLETLLILDESEMFFLFPEKYYCVYRNRCGKYIHKWDIGTDRKNKLYVTAQIMLFNLPSLSFENLLFNLYLERHWYYVNTDNKITKKVLMDTVTGALKKPFHLPPSKHGQFRVNKKYWEQRCCSANQAKMKIRQYLNVKEVKRLYNQSMTIDENLRILKGNGVRICEKTLKRMVSRGDIKIDTQEAAHAYLSCCPDPDAIRIIELIRGNEKITRAEIAKALGVGTATVSRRIKDMKGKMIDREGNNRSGRWIILPASRDNTGFDSTITTEDRSVQTEKCDSAFESDRSLVAFMNCNISDTNEKTVAVMGVRHSMRDCNESASSADNIDHNNCRHENKCSIYT